MIPQKSLSTVLIEGAYLPPDEIPVTSLFDYSLGGIELQDPSQGLQVQAWKAWIDDTSTEVWISSPTHPPSILFSKPALTEVSLTFDQNMRPFVAFVSFGNAGYWWWNSLISQQVFSLLPAGSISPRCTLDDKRQLELASSDIILAYIQAGGLYFRAQRDRYTIPYVLVGDIRALMGNPRINKVGMNDKGRLQFKMLTGIYG